VARCWRVLSDQEVLLPLLAWGRGFQGLEDHALLVGLGTHFGAMLWKRCLESPWASTVVTLQESHPRMWELG